MNLDEKNKILYLKSEFLDFMVNQENIKLSSSLYKKYSKLTCNVLGARSVSLFSKNNNGELLDSITYNRFPLNENEFEKQSQISNDKLDIEFDTESKYKIIHMLNQTFLYFWKCEENDINIVGFDFTGEERVLEQFSESFLLNFHKITFDLQNLLVKVNRTVEQGKQYLQLSKITTKLHSSFNVENVFSEIITSLRTVYPNNDYLLLLTNQTVEPSHLPVKQFSPMDKDANPYAIQAYSENINTYEKKNGSVYMYAPVQGQQGVYGVLQIKNKNFSNFTVYEQEFFTLLASKAGIALENAKLYQQVEDSAKRIQFVNEVGQNLNQNLNSLELIKYLVNKFQKRFECEEFAIILLDHEQIKVLDGSTSFFDEMESDFLVQRIIKELFGHDGTLLKVNASQEVGYQNYPFNSIVAVKVETTGLLGVSIMLHRDPFKFKYEDRTLVENVMEPTKLALRNTMLQEKLEQLVATDHLTGLYSRAYIEEQISKSMNEDNQGTLILLDIDDFKKINDTFGHQIGDNVLIQVSNVIKDVVRSTDIAARWGGEELAVYLPKIGIEHAKKVASRIIEEIERISNPRVTTSCGVSSWGGGFTSASIEKLFKSADDALYIAKNTGKNKVTIAN
ncbi:sensor domain-containing diguanylate cyclase [Gottfriedia luciferensis]|uniref:sensor domain-containing diguanylate cyclase n=1 Tax=Gottfriedia luciferensis TaxID=178774 RepID=UPI000B440505|nr:sensor domain-containing diguanylate cyclase [Gottfriedia luciferensis]